MVNNEKNSSVYLISELEKIYKLYDIGIFSNDEYNYKKTSIIDGILKNGINQKIDDFLFDILILKEQGILNIEEITLLKDNLVDHSNSKDNSIQINNDIYNINNDTLQTIDDYNTTANVDQYYKHKCSECQEEISVANSINKHNIIVCPKCSSLLSTPGNKSMPQITEKHLNHKEIIRNSEKKALIIIFSIIGIIGLAILINYIVYLSIN